MRRKHGRLLWLLSILLCLSLLSCGGAATAPEAGSTQGTSGETVAPENPPEGLLLAAPGTSAYRIVYREGASGREMRAVNALRDRLGETGAKVETRDDYLPRGETATPDACEILIGQTNRAATAAVLETLGERDYAARAVGSVLVIVGRTEALTVQAAEELTALLQPDSRGCIRFSNAMAFRHTAPQTLRVSFFGDSITTYEGYSDNAGINETLAQNLTWYRHSTLDAGETWWYRLTDAMGWELCVNNSYSGGRVSNAYSYETRAKNLHTSDGTRPDVIVIYFGINDYNNMVSLEEFRQAYAKLLDAIRAAYPEARLYCGNLIPILCSDNGRNTTLQENGAGVPLADFNRVIGTLAAARDVGVIDFAAAIGADQYRYTFDFIHPNAAGMQRMCDAALELLQEEFATTSSEPNS